MDSKEFIDVYRCDDTVVLRYSSLEADTYSRHVEETEYRRAHSAYTTWLLGVRASGRYDFNLY